MYVFGDRDSCSPAGKEEEGGRKKKEMAEKPTFPIYGNCPFHPTTYAKKREKKKEDTIAIDELTPPLRTVRERDGKHRCPTFLLFHRTWKRRINVPFIRAFFFPGKCVSLPAGLFCVRSIVENRVGMGGRV